ncbi:MAG: hypothetical protein WDO18_14885 [Acidobacteriota bacterium]
MFVLVGGVWCKAPGLRTNRKVLLVVGDSIAAGYGLKPGLSFPDVMQRTIDAEHRPWRVVNQGVQRGYDVGRQGSDHVGVETETVHCVAGTGRE